MNTRPCGACRHLDSREIRPGTAWCWRFYIWRATQDVITDCTGAERPNGRPPPGQITYKGPSP